MDMVVLYSLAVWNMIVFVLYGIDKHRAVKGLWRISEKTLILCAFFMGAVGAAAGMSAFRHKTKKMLFKLCVPPALFVNLGILILLERM